MPAPPPARLRVLQTQEASRAQEELESFREEVSERARRLAGGRERMTRRRHGEELERAKAAWRWRRARFLRRLRRHLERGNVGRERARERKNSREKKKEKEKRRKKLKKEKKKRKKKNRRR